MKNSHHPYNFSILCLLRFWFPQMISQKTGPSFQHNFWKFSLHTFSKWSWLEKSVYSSKNLWNNVFLFFIFSLEHSDVFWMFLRLFTMLNMVFCKDFLHFYDQIKHQEDNSFYPLTKNNKSIETLPTKET